MSESESERDLKSWPFAAGAAGNAVDQSVQFDHSGRYVSLEATLVKSPAGSECVAQGPATSPTGADETCVGGGLVFKAHRLLHLRLIDF